VVGSPASEHRHIVTVLRRVGRRRGSRDRFGGRTKIGHWLGVPESVSTARVVLALAIVRVQLPVASCQRIKLGKPSCGKSRRSGARLTLRISWSTADEHMKEARKRKKSAHAYARGRAMAGAPAARRGGVMVTVGVSALPAMACGHARGRGGASRVVVVRRRKPAAAQRPGLQALKLASTAHAGRGARRH
jgi:hypothetical protein